LSNSQSSKTVIASVCEAIQDNKEELDCFVAGAPRNDVDSSSHNFAFSRRHAPEFAAVISRHMKKRAQATHKRGRRECRVPDAPMVSCKKARGSHHRFTGFSPAFPAQWFYGFLRALPGDRLVATVARKKLASCELDASIGASGPHDFAVRVSAVRLRALLASIASHAQRP
jgi:hypothetical protein